MTPQPTVVAAQNRLRSAREVIQAVNHVIEAGSYSTARQAFR
ncbi:hypothetical protein JMJ77_0011865 [Colletotrichum scovillei]|uniref:Uncharacterized protein n=1 Tax=Colletotrichum scovillei TaxID=1209932 RepID=A0A9P7QXL1_9PEZI|nr:hypothetical protein JMJ77_0011865 [Colletotrichum scovillei]KAG7046151.1 hypothetical protein JMJ78_0011218 [Colletotrichum scovillei]KAG7063496.1 hypothetical protein JMJ76_0005960 [Colletotrichum scovillei]